VRRGLLLLIVLLALMLGGGALTANLLTDAPTIIQSTDPNASVFEATPEQAAQFIFWVFFVLFNLVGAGATIAFLMWRGNVEVRRANAMPKASELQANENQLADGSNA
jgi:hypothetical protein